MINTCYDERNDYKNGDVSTDNLAIVPIGPDSCRIEFYCEFYHDIRDKGIYIPEQIDCYYVAEISSRAYQNADIDYVSIPKTVKTISSSAFEGSKVKTINFIEGVHPIHHRAFSNCKNQSTINFFSSMLQTIKNEVFYGSVLT